MDRKNRAIGAMFFAFFGAMWLVSWCLQVYGGNLVVLMFIGICGLGIFMLALRQLRKARSVVPSEKVDPTEGRKLWRNFNIVNAVQWILIAIVSSLLIHFKYPDWIIPSVMVIVGLHFLPLAIFFKSPPLIITGVAMVMLAIVYPFVLPEGPASPVGCLGAGIILWVSGISALRNAF